MSEKLKEKKKLYNKKYREKVRLLKEQEQLLEQNEQQSQEAQEQEEPIEEEETVTLRKEDYDKLLFFLNKKQEQAIQPIQQVQQVQEVQPVKGSIMMEILKGIGLSVGIPLLQKVVMMKLNSIMVKKEPPTEQSSVNTNELYVSTGY